LQELAHVRGGSRNAEQAGFPLDESRDALGRPAALREQVEQDARVEVAAARAHHDPARRRQAHRRIDGRARSALLRR
jgi:hypothetical protein